MAEPIEYKRIFQKVDTYDGWMANPLILGDGEWANVRVGGVIVNYRIGDGTKRFSELPNVIQYDQAAYVAPSGDTLPVPQNGIGYSILTAGNYNGGALVVPAGNLGIADYVGNAWVVRSTPLPSTPIAPGGAGSYEDVETNKGILRSFLPSAGEGIPVNTDTWPTSHGLFKTGQIVSAPGFPQWRAASGYDVSNFRTFRAKYIPTYASNVDGQNVLASLVGIVNGGNPVVLEGVPLQGSVEVIDKVYDVSNYDTISFAYDHSYAGTVLEMFESAGFVGEDSVRKSIDAALTEAKEFTLARVGSMGAVNVLDYGADPSGSNSSTSAFNQALAELVRQGGGRIYAPNGRYKVNISIPDTQLKWMNLEIFSDESPVQSFGTIGNIELSNRGLILLPDNEQLDIINQPATSSGFSGFNIVTVILKNMTVRNSLATRANAINLANAGGCILENIQIDNGVFSVQAPDPLFNTAGIITPKESNSALTILRNISISGHNRALVVNEHTYADYLNLTCNKHAIWVEAAHHASHIVRACVQRNQVGIYGNGRHRLTIDQLNLEHANVSQTDPNNSWQLTQWDVNDPNNYIKGRTEYSVVVGDVGYDIADWKKNGGENFITTPI